MDKQLRTLQKQIKALEERKASVYATARAEALSKIAALMQEFTLSLDEVQRARYFDPIARSPRKAQRAKATVQYVGPNQESWTGRGRPPRWLTDAEAAGRNRGEFYVGSVFGSPMKVQKKPTSFNSEL